jgi:sec-independent protein translocase protein TatA
VPGFIGMPELLLLGLVALLVFGPKRLPEMGRSMGRGLREFKSSISGDAKGDEDAFSTPLLAPEDETAVARMAPNVVERERVA